MYNIFLYEKGFYSSRISLFETKFTSSLIAAQFLDANQSVQLILNLALNLWIFHKWAYRKISLTPPSLDELIYGKSLNEIGTKLILITRENSSLIVFLKHKTCRWAILKKSVWWKIIVNNAKTKTTWWSSKMLARGKSNHFLQCLRDFSWY